MEKCRLLVVGRPLFQVAGVNADGKPRPQLPENPPLALALQSHALAMLRENALLYMHRSFFAKALSEHPDDPFKARRHPPLFTRHPTQRLLNLEPVCHICPSLPPISLCNHRSRAQASPCRATVEYVPHFCLRLTPR